MTEIERFFARFEKGCQDGLQDMKFYVRHGGAMSLEDFYAAANRIDDAIERGDCIRRPAWDKDMPPQEADVLRA